MFTLFVCFTFVCPFVALLKATCAENSHIVDIEKSSFVTSRVFWFNVLTGRNQGPSKVVVVVL